MAEIDPRLVRLVARHFNDLRGLETAVLGAGMVGISAVWLPSADPAATTLAAIALGLPFFYVMRRLDCHYTEQFGRVVHATAAFRYRGAVVLAGIALGLGSSDTVPWWLFWAFMGGQSLWLLVDGWPFRFQELFMLAALLCAAVLTRQHDAVSLAQAFFLFGLAHIVTGLADHRLLVRATRGNGEGSREYADTV